MRQVGQVSSGLVKIRYHAPQLLYGVGLHQDEVFGEEERGDLGELPDGGRVSVRDNTAQLVESIVQVVHPSPLPGINREPDVFLLTRFVLPAGCQRPSTSATAVAAGDTDAGGGDVVFATRSFGAFVDHTALFPFLFDISRRPSATTRGVLVLDVTASVRVVQDLMGG